LQGARRRSPASRQAVGWPGAPDRCRRGLLASARARAMRRVGCGRGGGSAEARVLTRGPAVVGCGAQGCWCPGFRPARIPDGELRGAARRGPACRLLGLGARQDRPVPYRAVRRAPLHACVFSMLDAALPWRAGHVAQARELVFSCLLRCLAPGPGSQASRVMSRRRALLAPAADGHVPTNPASARDRRGSTRCNSCAGSAPSRCSCQPPVPPWIAPRARCPTPTPPQPPPRTLPGLTSACSCAALTRRRGAHLTCSPALISSRCPPPHTHREAARQDCDSHQGSQLDV